MPLRIKYIALHFAVMLSSFNVMNQISVGNMPSLEIYPPRKSYMSSIIHIFRVSRLASLDKWRNQESNISISENASDLTRAFSGSSSSVLYGGSECTRMLGGTRKTQNDRDPVAHELFIT